MENTTETTTATSATSESKEATEATSTTETPKPALFEEIPDAESDTESEPETPPESNGPEQLKKEDIKLPEGYEYDEELGTSFLGIANEHHIPKEAVQKLFDLYQTQWGKIQEGLKAAELEREKKFKSELEREKADWLKQCESDSEYGGQKWEEAQAIIDRGCKQLASEGAVKLMQAYNLNYHPEIVRMFYRAGLLSGEDKSQMTGNGGRKENDAAMAIFGESLKEYHKRRGEI